MKKSLAIAFVVIGLILVTGSVYTWKKLPPSLDQYYEPNFLSTPPVPPEYLIDMFELGTSMMGVVVNIDQGDFANATLSYRDFQQNYENSSRLVPQWRKYYDQKAVKRLGKALDAHDIPGVFEAIGEIGETCIRCHRETMPPVWNKYNWRDFETVMIDTPDGPMPWPEAKMKYLVIGFDGIGVNIRQNNQFGANRSFDLFKAMFDNMTDSCSSCHTSPRMYYVSGDIQTMITDVQSNITDGNLNQAGILLQGIGMESCYRCHVLHVPAQFAKTSRK